MALAFRITINKKKGTSIHKVLIAILHCLFLLCHNLHLHMLKNCGIGKTVLAVSCARFKTHICKDPLPPVEDQEIPASVPA